MPCARWLCIPVLVFVIGSLNTGCGKREPAAPTKNPAEVKKAPSAKKFSHGGWWCDEHGIPEHLCSLCNEEEAARLKKEGDWCKLHDRALSQCFKCDPGKYARFEEMYVAKFNRKPLRPPESEFQK